MDLRTKSLLVQLAEEVKVKEKVEAMFRGERINATEGRAVLHTALRASRDDVVLDQGVNVVPMVWEVLDRIRALSDSVRSGERRGSTGKPLTDVVAIGIGGSFLGPLFVHTALTADPEAAEAARGRRLRFIANVDPVDLASKLHDLDPETTLVVVVSKTFTTAETMLNARTVRAWLVARLGERAISRHVVAVSTNDALVKEFGIEPSDMFGFWEWVGGRYSVSSAVGVLPLALQYGFPVVERFLAGLRDMDRHFRSAPADRNIPMLMGLASVWNVSFLGHSVRAILPYQEALGKLPAHVQQLSMESNGKGVAIDGSPLLAEAGEVDFGEPGTNGQHSFYQLVHQGRVVPCDFIGVVRPQQPARLCGELVSNHDELMCNFFAQPDALAIGRTAEEVAAAGVPPELVPHKTFHGNRPSLSLLLPELSAFTIGQLLAVYEHRIVVQGFLWGINSFDQWGVELGKELAGRVRGTIGGLRGSGGRVGDADGYNRSTARLINRYLDTADAATPGTTTLGPLLGS